MTLALAAALAGCGAGSAPTPSTTLGVSERDFHIRAPGLIHAGAIRLQAHNNGPDTHELFIVRTSTDELPLRSDGLTVDEDAIARDTVASVDGIPPGHTGQVTVSLRPGRYLLFCNMAGHFRGGMHRVLVVQ